MADSSNLATWYLMNTALLIAHEIDSAYWREWELFRLPGGEQFFLVLNLTLVLLALHGFRLVIAGRPPGRVYSWCVVGAGAIAVVVHAAFLASGNPAFTLPTSLVILGAIFVASLMQARATLAWRHASGERP